MTEEYCSSPDCQINYGSGCDGNQRPSGVDTSTVARPHLGDVLYGGLGIYDCDKAGDIALTFDDGPYNYTGDLLDKFAVCSAFMRARTHTYTHTYGRLLKARIGYGLFSR